MKLDTKTIVIGGLLLYMLSRRGGENGNNNNTPAQNFPPAPVQNTPSWQLWANTIIGTAGNVASLWQPGGPFYNQPTQDVIDATGVAPPSGDLYNDPNYNPYGWA